MNLTTGFRLITLFIIVVLTSAITIAQEISIVDKIKTDIIKKMKSNEIQHIALVYVDNESNYRCDPLRELIESALINMLQSKQGLKIVDRANVEKILEEQKLQLTGIINDNSIGGIGELLGAQSLLLYRFDFLENKISINIRITDVSSSEIIYSGNTFSKITKPLNEIIQSGKYVFYAEAIGTAPDKPNMSESQKRQLAERAAKMIASRDLIEQIKGFYLSSTTTVENHSIMDDEIVSKVNGYIKNAEVISVEYVNSNAVNIVLKSEIDKSKTNSKIR